MPGEILVRALKEDKLFIRDHVEGKREQDRLHVIVQKYREVTGK